MTYGDRVRRICREHNERAKHQPCPCGCGEMRDECPRGHNPIGVFRNTFGILPCGCVPPCEGHREDDE